MPEYWTLTKATLPYFNQNVEERLERGEKVKVEFVDKERSLSQNGLMAEWYKDISLHKEGHTPLRIKCICKHDIGIPIILASTAKKSQETRDIWNGVSDQLNYVGRMQLLRQLKVTSVMTVKEATQYLDEMQDYWAREGIVLTTPADCEYAKYKEAA